MGRRQPSSTELPWRFIEHERNVHELRFDDVRTGWEQWVLLTSDLHWDNPKCRWDLLKKHLDEAVERKAPVFSFGDHFCCMQGKFDKRSDKGDIRPEHQHGDYLDSLVSTAAEWFAPYANNLVLVTPGNHETAILKHHETCLVTRLCERLRHGGGQTRIGGYSGWVRIQWEFYGCMDSQRLAYHHGWGGGGPITKGVIDFNRMSEMLDADFYVAGHVHWKGYQPVKRVRLNKANKVNQDTVHYIRSGSYKDEFQQGQGGFHIEKGRGPRKLGGWWLRFSAGKCNTRRKSGAEKPIHVDVIETSE
jgi:hypothetical protein